MILKLKNDHVIYLSKGWQKRDFLYITDAVEGITQTIVNFEKLQGNLNIILGSGFSVTVRELTNKLKKISMSKASLIFDGSKQEPTRLINRGKYPKLQELIDWEPKVSFEGLVEMMVKSDLDLAKQEKILLENNLISPTWENPI